MSKAIGAIGKQLNQKPNARLVALYVLARVEEEHAYSNLVLNDTLRQASLARADAGLATEIVYGTIQRQLTLDYLLENHVQSGLGKLETWVCSLLRLSVYQLFYLDKIPTHAAIHEAVQIAKTIGHAGIGGMVNAVLRNVVRAFPEGERKLLFPEQMSHAKKLSITYAHPLWLVKKWLDQFGEATTIAICEANNRPPASSARVNVLRGSRDQMLDTLRSDGLDAAASVLSPDGIVVRQAGHLAASRYVREGQLTIQDESSMLVARALDAKPGMRVLDCCAAPGGKTTHIAETMDDTGELIANDIHAHKAQLIAGHAERLGLTCIRTHTADALTLADTFEPESFDRILLDAPCSGLGVIRRKPEIKWQKEAEHATTLAALQLQLLERASTLLKPDGALVYSTCTITKEENAAVIQAFLQRHPTYVCDVSWMQVLAPDVVERCAADGQLQVLPSHFDSDGFFIARLVKK